MIRKIAIALCVVLASVTAQALEVAPIAPQTPEIELAINGSAQRLAHASLSLYVSAQGSWEAEILSSLPEGTELTRYLIERLGGSHGQTTCEENVEETRACKEIRG